MRFAGVNNRRHGARAAACASAAAVLVLTLAMAMAAPAPPATAATGLASRDGAAANKTPLVVIVMESGRYKGIVGNSRAPFINRTLIAHGLLATNYFGVPDSMRDYLLMVSGQKRPPASAPNLFARLGRAPTWREYMESMPRPCYTGGGYHRVNGTNAALYARSHNPAIHFTAITKTSLCSRVVPLVPKRFHPGSLPRLSFVVPNQCNDMHTLPVNRSCPMWNGNTNKAATELALGDRWLAKFVPLVAKRATVVVTWDEANRRNEHVPTILYGVGVRHGRIRALLHHQSLEAGLYRYFGLGKAPGRGATATALVIP